MFKMMRLNKYVLGTPHIKILKYTSEPDRTQGN